jgi:hypothetical protein
MMPLPAIAQVIGSDDISPPTCAGKPHGKINWKSWALTMIFPTVMAIVNIALGILSGDPLFFVQGALIMAGCGLLHYHWHRIGNDSRACTLSTIFGIIVPGLWSVIVTAIAQGSALISIAGFVVLGGLIGINNFILEQGI